ncbi:hypothetical protein GUITHDRAFT_131505 [Guillardia theta CCMP2712]|uniref:Bacterial bifunctional deaminase-reductase C-terminal domain-containing protein n=1 Tax=Guillardia theta (strain CCMP2712) TaxID=905079 RepID=L1K367_GUITC|nr:hypothetical protein GUITHDRAFT_131505 [Guillardia theta CCMP2712]EKX55261.1 hypothetical protein GUITHDRAFT_131505 [Guillardia theta CCMP2712]|eukprot:XP_005842241.1 hypothetical protein GUITHDRAFT_131505 [Guillardia theta CCMP2712]
MEDPMRRPSLQATSSTAERARAACQRLSEDSIVEELTGKMKVTRERLQLRRENDTSSLLSPYVTLTFAQTLDGSIATLDRRPLEISCNESMVMTHHLRSVHDCILVGIGTVRSDDPSLTVRLCNGSNPKPVVLDPRLTIRRDCRLLSSPACVRPIVACSRADLVNSSRAVELEALGCTVMGCELQANGHVDLVSVLCGLASLRMKSVMVEGGAQV